MAEILSAKELASLKKENKMQLCMICQFKNGSERLTDWILYHYTEGFDSFVLFDDYSTDNSVQVLNDLKNNLKINIHVFKTDGQGPVYDHLDQNSNTYLPDGQFHNRIIRSYMAANNFVKSINPECICAFLDIDEFLVTNNDTNLKNVIGNIQKDLFYINSFDVSDQFELKKWYSCDKATAQRWDYQSRSESIYRWRVKSIAKSKVINEIPLNVGNMIHTLKLIDTEEFYQNSISDYNFLRIHHFRKPINDAPIVLIHDDTLLNKCKKIKDLYENKI